MSHPRPSRILTALTDTTDHGLAVLIVEHARMRAEIIERLELIGHPYQIVDRFDPSVSAAIESGNPVIVVDIASVRSGRAGRLLGELIPDFQIDLGSIPILAMLDDRSHGAVGTALSFGADEIVFVPEELSSFELRLEMAARNRARALAEQSTSSKSSQRDERAVLAAVERQARELKLLHQIRNALAVDFELASLFQTIVQQISAAFGYTHVSLYTLENDEYLTLQHQIGYEDELRKIPINRGVAGRVARTGEFALIEDVDEEPEFLAAVPNLRSEVCVPFFLDGRVVGILNIESAGNRSLNRDDLTIMSEIAGYLSLAVERSALTMAVRASEQHLRIAVEAAGMGTWVWNPTSGDVDWSEQMGPLYGLPMGTKRLTAEQWFRLIHPDDREYIRNADRQIVRFGNDYEIEFRVILPSGAIRWLEGKGKVTEKNAEGQVIAITGITMDVTGRKRLEEERLRLVQLEVEREKAKEAQQLITDTLERMTAAFVAIDRDWNITYLNNHARSMLQPIDSELVGLAVWDGFPEICGSEVEDVLRAAAESQVAATFETHWPSRERWIEMHIYPNQQGLSVYLQDVTERRLNEEERRRSQERFRSLVQNASDIIVILGRDGIVHYASPAVERVIGVKPERVVGSDNYSLVHPQDAKRLRRAFIKVAKSPGVSDPILLRFRHRNGNYRWLEVTATNLLNDPTIQGIVANCRDVTDRHEAEHNLWFLAETSAVLGTSLDLETTLSSVARLVVMNFGDMCIVDVVNEFGEAEAFAVSHRDAAEERQLHQIRSDWPLTSESAQDPGYVLRTGQSVLLETIDAESQQLWTNAPAGQLGIARMGFQSAIIAPLVARGTTTGVLTVASLTPGKFGPGELSLIEELARRAALAVDNARLYRAAQAAIEARDQFLSVAAHELRTPITAITGFGTLLEREVHNRNDSERVDRYVRRLTGAGNRLASLVDDMLDVSRIRLGQLPLRIDRVDLVGLIQRIVARYEEQDPALPHLFTFRATGDSCVVPADEDRLDQVLTNVIDNSTKYSPEGGEIVITLAPERDGYLIRVGDDGIGLPMADVESIFDPFGRGSNVAMSNLPGLGIGLYICRNIIERHDGRIWAESAGEDQGSTFSIWLPTAVQEEAPA